MRKRDQLFLLGAGLLLLIIGPYVYYTSVVYSYIHEYALSKAGKDFTQMPQITDLWITLASAVIINRTMHVFEKAVQPYVYKFAKRKANETEDMLLFKSKKASHNVFMSIWHTFSTLGLLYCIRGKAWTPSYMLGLGSGSFINGFPNMPFSPMDKDGYMFGLIILGHPV